MRCMRAQSMAVRAHDIAFANLREQPRSRQRHRAALGQAEQLVCRIPVVEVHLMRLEDFATVGARALPEIPQQRNGHSLASSHSRNLALAIPPVVASVGCMLARAMPHDLV